MTDDTSAPVSFSDLGLPKAILEAVAKVGYETASPIQAASIPPLLEGRDLLGMAQTGTGKTAAFALPLLARLDANAKTPQMLILAPTRELAIQVAEACNRYAANLKGFHILPVYGGSDMGGQVRQLKRGVQVVVGTPGRVMDHMRRGTLKLDGLKALVLDEADEMLRMGFIDDINWVLESCPEEKQVALFSATMPREIQKVTERYLRNPITVKIKSETATVDSIEQSYVLVKGHEKLETLTRLLEVEEFTGVIIFVRTKNATAEVAEKLEARGYATSALNGDMSQQLRERAINRLKQRKLDIIVATDVAARGIDVSTVSHVINYDIPYDSEAYVHRIGRTGRAGREGKAILFVAPREQRMLRTIERATKQPIAKYKLPSSEEIGEQRVQQFKETIKSVLDSEKLEFFEKLIGECADEFEKSGSEIAAALAYMAQKERPLRLPKDKPQRVQEERPRRERSERKDRDDRPKRERKSRPEQDGDISWIKYRMDVGKKHGVKPGDIVGAIANEAGIDSEYIGRIELQEQISYVHLPEGMPKEIFQHLKKVRIRQQPINMTQSSGDDSSGDDKPRKRKPRD